MPSPRALALARAAECAREDAERNAAQAHPASKQHLLLTELLKNGLIRHEAWIPAACTRAASMYANEGLHVGAMLLAALHPLAVQYLEQAPVLVLAGCYGVTPHKEKERIHIARKWSEAVAGGPKLRDLLARYGCPLQLRQIRANALTPNKWDVIRHLSSIAPSSLAQSIPPRHIGQREWLSALKDWHGQLSRVTYAGPEADRWTPWAAVAIGLAVQRKQPGVPIADAIAIADFMGARAHSFNPAWTWDQAHAAAERWHGELAAKSDAEKFAQRHGIGFADPIDYGALPVEESVKGFSFVALRSAEQIFVEGRMMRHCVASYTDRVVHGASRLFSIRVSDRSIATLELSPVPPHSIALSAGPVPRRWLEQQSRWYVAQLKGPCNAPAGAKVREATEAFAEIVNARAPRPQAGVPAAAPASLAAMRPGNDARGCGQPGGRE